jgi:hypothetical protein
MISIPLPFAKRIWHFTFLNKGEIMKNIILALIVFVGFAGSFSMAGECANGLCVAQIRPVRKIVNVTREVVVAPVRAVVAIATPNTCCDTVKTTNPCDCGCSTSNKTVTKYQPLRRRLVNRSTSVSCCE